MGFLDDLKNQASSLQARQAGDLQSAARTTQLVEAAALGAQRYLMELARHLDVIRPTARRRYALDRRLVLEALPMVDFRFDARRKVVRDQELIDHVMMVCSVRSGRAVQLAKDFINEIELLERRLAQAGITFEREAVRHADHGKLIEMRYEFVADVELGVRLRCDHDAGRLHFSLRNLDGLETVDCSFPAHAVTQARLDELARWWLGEPHRFLDEAQDLRRVEAR
jgi:hypothetical protein